MAPRIAAVVLINLLPVLTQAIEEALVLLPCNTLAPTAWLLAEKWFATREGLTSVIEHYTDESLHASLHVLADHIAEGRCHIRFPTVPEAVITYAMEKGTSTILPLGTEGICETYRKAARRLDASAQVDIRDPIPQDKQHILDAIEAAIGGIPEQRKAAHADLERILAMHGPDVMGVEACTDLDYGVALDSNKVYARHVVELIYGNEHARK